MNSGTQLAPVVVSVHNAERYPSKSSGEYPESNVDVMTLRYMRYRKRIR